MKKVLLTFFSLLFFTSVGLSQFTIHGHTVAGVPGDGCYQLTEAINSQVGVVWSDTPVDLTESFSASAQVYYGDGSGLNGGADGMAFVMHPNGTGQLPGGAGGGLGLLNIPNAFGACIRTWNQDKVGIYNNLLQLLPGSTETPIADPDDNFHLFAVNWNAPSQTMHVFLDGNLMSTYSGDIVNTVLGGNSSVTWGYAAATGGANALQQVCDIKMATVVPTMGQWTFLIFGLIVLILGVVGVYALQRRRKLA